MLCSGLLSPPWMTWSIWHWYIKRALPRHILGTIKNDKMKGGLACYCRRVRIVMRMIPSRVCLCSTRLIARRNILEYSVFSSRSMENDRAVSSIRVPLRQIFLLASGGSVVRVVYFVHPAVIKGKWADTDAQKKSAYIYKHRCHDGANVTASSSMSERKTLISQSDCVFVLCVWSANQNGPLSREKDCSLLL